MIYIANYLPPIWKWDVGPASEEYENTGGILSNNPFLPLEFKSSSGLSFSDQKQFTFGPFLKWSGKSSQVLIVNDKVKNVISELNLFSHKVINTPVQHPLSGEKKQYYAFSFADEFWKSINYSRSIFSFQSIPTAEILYQGEEGEFLSYSELGDQVGELRKQEPALKLVPVKITHNQFFDILPGRGSVILFSEYAVNEIREKVNVIGNIEFKLFDEYEVRF